MNFSINFSFLWEKSYWDIERYCIWCVDCSKYWDLSIIKSSGWWTQDLSPFILLLLLLFSYQVVSNSFATPWTVACQGSLFMGFPREENWSGLPFPSLGDLPDPGVEPTSPALAGGFLSEPPGKPLPVIQVLFILAMFYNFQLYKSCTYLVKFTPVHFILSVLF